MKSKKKRFVNIKSTMNRYLTSRKQSMTSKQEWKELSADPNALDVFDIHWDKVDWSGLSRNPAAIHILENNMDKVDFNELILNPMAGHLVGEFDDEEEYQIDDKECEEYEDM